MLEASSQPAGQPIIAHHLGSLELSRISNPWAYAVSFLEMAFSDQILASGSCFFWKLNDRIFLITNWHNLSGRNPVTKQPMSGHGGVPDRILVTVFKKASETDAKGDFKLSRHRVSVLLYDGDDEPIWIQHPIHGRKIDIGALDVTDHLNGYFVRCANDIEADMVRASHVSQEVFVIGFPLGQIIGLPTPIWKRATIASDPAFEPEGLPKLLVDTATRSGMSGSVVVARHQLNFQEVQKKDGSVEDMAFMTGDIVLGVYSGRLGQNEVEAQLGIVWKRPAIDETIAGQVRAEVK
jgi:hypothetical protein